MSYCRFSNGDVYMYSSVYGYIECCNCEASGKRFQVNAFPSTLMPFMVKDIFRGARYGHVAFKNRHRVTSTMTKEVKRSRAERRAEFHKNQDPRVKIKNGSILGGTDTRHHLVGCLVPRNLHFYSSKDALAHLLMHKHLGHTVPKTAISRLIKESAREEN